MTDSSGSEEEEYEEELDQSAYYHDSRGHLFLYIETLTGTSFEMRVSPFETIVSIKAKLQQLEGIPVVQQHLLHNSRELPNKLSLYECGVPDGATLKLVLKMRGGPINTRKIVVQDDSTKELEEAVERSKEELLEHIPEGGHVTVLVFRDGDNINLYHVLERPDGSYSPLSDSWSGASIRNLFAEQDDPEVEQRIRENANTMSKMHEIKTQMERVGVRRQHTMPRESPRRAGATPELGRSNTSNLPPIRRRRSLGREEWDVPGEGGHRSNRKKLPKVKVDKQRTIDFSTPSPSPPLGSHRNTNNNHYEPSSRYTGRQRTEALPHSSRQRPPSKLISLDVSQLKKTVDDNDGFAPSLRTPLPRNTRARSSLQGRRKSGRQRENNNDESDIFYRPGLATSPRAPAIPPLENNERSDIFHRAPPRSPAVLPPFLTSPRKPPGPPAHQEGERQDYLFNLNLSDSLSRQASPRLRQHSSAHRPSIQEPALDPDAPAPRGLERRLLHSRRGRLGRRKSPSGSPSRVPTVLASPKGHSRERTSPRTSPRLMRPSFPTRPLSGPKRKKTPKPRCAETECRKKINITNSYSCRCELAFCAAHRHPEAHACSHDYKTEGRKLLAASHPAITVPKLPKI